MSDISIDQQFVEFIVKSLVGNPDAVAVERTIDEKGVLLELTVDQEDLGRVIGKRGSTAQSIRTLLRALGVKNDARYNLKIVDPEGDARRAERGDRFERDDDRGYSRRDNNQRDNDFASNSSASSAVTSDDDDDSTSDDKYGDTRKELADMDDLDL